jgi:6-phosphogluconolactonase
MEFVGAPVTKLRALIRSSFEDWAKEPGTARRSCALSGGSTALIFLGALRDAQVDWKPITLFWVDERAVAPDDPESNYGVAERMLLKPLGKDAPHVVRMPTDKMPLNQAALWYDEALATELHNAPLDLAILGIGEDGHVASLFPGHRALLVDDLRAVAIEDAPKLPPRRLSLTMRFLLQTKKIWVIAIGPRKFPVLLRAIDKQTNTTPLDLLLRQAKDVTIFTDQNIHRS